MNKLKKVVLASSISFLLSACTSQEQQVKLDDPLYKNEKCYYEATSSQSNHISNQVESEIRYNRCRRN